MNHWRYISFMITGFSVLYLSACASNTAADHPSDLKPDQTAQLDENIVIQLPAPETSTSDTSTSDTAPLRQRLIKRATQGTATAVQGVANVMKDTGEIATKATIAGVRIGSRAASGASEIIIEETKRTADRFGKGMDFVMTAPPANDAASPVGNKTLTDAALSPLSDFNIRKRERPEVLMRLQEDDLYFVELEASCPWYDARIEELDDVLGDDYDVEKESSSNLEKMGQAGKGAVLSSVASAAGTYIPGRSIVRSLSGAKARQKKTRQIYQKGVARRSFLNGVALAKGCDGY